jgi:SAM-dependent methyltransferase
MRTDMITYYRQRAGEYERIYAKPERQGDLARLRAIVEAAFSGHHVLELSCGTGYWTEAIASEAMSVVACDVSLEMLEIARSKDWGSARVEFVEADSYALPDFGWRHSAAFAGFWWSHIPRRRIEGFLAGLHARLKRGAKVMFIDNRYVEGSSTPISRVDKDGDCFQQRRLENGSIHEVLKNFPSKEELLCTVAGVTSSAVVTLTDYFWVLTYDAS